MSTKRIAGSDLLRHTNVKVRVTQKDNLFRDIDLPLTVYQWDRPREITEWKISKVESTRYITTPLQVFPDGNKLMLYRTIGKQEQFTYGCQTETGQLELKERSRNPEIAWEDRRSREYVCTCAMQQKEWLLEKLHARNREFLETENISEQPVKWYVKLERNLKRPGLRGFGTMPVGLMPELWMREMNPRELEVVGAAHSRIRFSIRYQDTLAERITISWPNLIFIEHTELNYPALAWVKCNCVGSIIPFSALPSMFTEPVDEILYTNWFDGEL